jgi:hypothetical protein
MCRSYTPLITHHLPLLIHYLYNLLVSHLLLSIRYGITYGQLYLLQRCAWRVTLTGSSSVGALLCFASLLSMLTVNELNKFCVAEMTPDNQEMPKRIQHATHRRYQPRYEMSELAPAHTPSHSNKLVTVSNRAFSNELQPYLKL